jgi:hypothetical protein
MRECRPRNWNEPSNRVGTDPSSCSTVERLTTIWPGRQTFASIRAQVFTISPRTGYSRRLAEPISPAVFSAPADQPDHAVRAVRVAQGMRAALRPWRWDPSSGRTPRLFPGPPPQGLILQTFGVAVESLLDEKSKQRARPTSGAEDVALENPIEVLRDQARRNRRAFDGREYDTSTVPNH